MSDSKQIPDLPVATDLSAEDTFIKRNVSTGTDEQIDAKLFADSALETGEVTTATGTQTVAGALDSRVIYVDTIADLQALPVGELVDGQVASVKGSEFRWAGAWALLSSLSIDAFDGTDAERLEMAASFLSGQEGGGEIVFPPRVYEFDRPAVISTGNITLTFSNGASFAPSTGSVIYLIPQSLVDSGRLTGDDYPSSWRDSSGNPTPFEGDFWTMMLESDPALRLKNITIRGANFEGVTQATFLTAASVDNLKIHDSQIAPENFSSIRYWHCDGVQICNNVFSGGGTYEVFSYKSRNEHLFQNKFSGESRAFSIKGVYHESGDIFSENSNDVIESNINFYKNEVVYSGSDDAHVLVSLHNPDGDNYTLDAALDAGASTSIGFTKMDWLGLYPRGLKVFKNNFVSKNINAVSVRSGGLYIRALEVAGNEFYNLRTILFYVKSAVIRSNEFFFSLNTQTPIFMQYDSRVSSSPEAVTVIDNKLNGVSGANECIRAVAKSGIISNNFFYHPTIDRLILCLADTGAIAINNNTAIVDSSGVATRVVTTLSGGNPNGYEFSNTIINEDSGSIDQGVSSLKGGGPDQGLNSFVVKENGRYAGIVLEDAAGARALRMYYDSIDQKTYLRTRAAGMAAFVLRDTGQVGFDGQGNSTSATGGDASAPPSQPVGYVTLEINGTLRKIPYYGE